MTGRFITFEGGEGTGKSTQVALLCAKLRQFGIASIVTREPGGTPNAEEIRSMLVTGEPDRWDAMSELCLLNAARADHVSKVIRPALERGEWVICDRFIHSTIVYQGLAKGISHELIFGMHNLTTGGLMPDLTLILDLPVPVAFERMTHRASDENRFEKHDDAFHFRVADAFRQLGTGIENICLIDGSGFPQDVAARVWDEVLPRISSMESY